MERPPPRHSDAPNRSDIDESEEWCLPIYHEVCSIGLPTPTTQNLCDIIDQSNVFNKVAYRFCTTKYDVSKEGKEGKEVRAKLERSLIDAAKDSSGLELVVASGMGSVDKTGARRAFVIQCDCSLYYKSSKYDQENNIVNPTNVPHKRSSLHNDGANKRSAKNGGKNGNHRRGTKRILDRKGEAPCKFRLPVYIDSDGYFIKGRVGCSTHSQHLKPCPEFAALTNSTRNLPEEQRKCLRSVVQAHAGATAAANVLYEMFGTHISVNQSRGAGNRKRNLHDDDDALRTLLMEHKSVSVFLYQGKTKHPTNHGAVIDTLTNEISDGTNGQSMTIIKPAILEPTEMASVHDYTNRVRASQNYEDDQEVMVAFAWVRPFEMKRFRLFPFVIHLDGTKCTNNERRVLFTVSGRDSMGKQFVFLRAFIPNETAWMFKWLFGNVMPTLLGEDLLRRVRMVITDGDSQETSQFRQNRMRVVLAS
jgi:hypothetical protein